MAEIKIAENAVPPPVPPAGMVTIYADAATKQIFSRDDLGNIYGPFGAMPTPQPVGPSNAVYVALNGNDGTGTRGDPSKPFLTVKAGLAACQDGDILLIGPGTYTMGVGQTPVWPAGVNRLTIVGAGNDLTGNGGTVLLNTANDGSHIFAPPSTATYVEIRNLYAAVTAGTGCALYCDGTGGGGNYLGGALNGGLNLQDCVLTGAANAIYLKNVGLATFRNVVTSIGAPCLTEFLTSNVAFLDGGNFGDVTITWDASDVDKPSIGRLGVTARSSSMETLTLSGQPNVTLHDCRVDTVTGWGLDSIGEFAPRLKVYGGEVGNVDFLTPGAEFPDTSASQELRLYGVRIETQFGVAASGSVNRLAVTARGCQMPSNAASVQAGEGVDLDLRGSYVDPTGSALQTIGTGTVSVDRIHRQYTLDGTGHEVVSITAGGGVMFTNPPANVQITPRGIDAGIIACPARSETNIEIIYSNSVIEDVDIVASWD